MQIKEKHSISLCYTSPIVMEFFFFKLFKKYIFCNAVTFYKRRYDMATWSHSVHRWCTELIQFIKNVRPPFIYGIPCHFCTLPLPPGMFRTTPHLVGLILVLYKFKVRRIWVSILELNYALPLKSCACVLPPLLQQLLLVATGGAALCVPGSGRREHAQHTRPPISQMKCHGPLPFVFQPGFW